MWGIIVLMDLKKIKWNNKLQDITSKSSKNAIHIIYSNGKLWPNCNWLLSLVFPLCPRPSHRKQQHKWSRWNLGPFSIALNGFLKKYYTTIFMALKIFNLWEQLYSKRSNVFLHKHFPRQILQDNIKSFKYDFQ